MNRSKLAFELGDQVELMRDEDFRFALKGGKFIAVHEAMIFPSDIDAAQRQLWLDWRVPSRPLRSQSCADAESPDAEASVRVSRAMYGRIGYTSSSWSSLCESGGMLPRNVGTADMRAQPYCTCFQGLSHRLLPRKRLRQPDFPTKHSTRKAGFKADILVEITGCGGDETGANLKRRQTAAMPGWQAGHAL